MFVGEVNSLTIYRNTEYVCPPPLVSPLKSRAIKPVNLKRNSTLNIHWQDWYWSWSSNTLATWCKELTHWKRPWCWESWVPKNWCFWTVVLEKTLASPLDCKEIQPVHPKWDQSWVFIGRTDAEAETPILWPPDVKSWLIWKDLDAGKDWGQEEKGTTEDELVGWHHPLNGHGFGWTPGAGDR